MTDTPAPPGDAGSAPEGLRSASDTAPHASEGERPRGSAPEPRARRGLTGLLEDGPTLPALL
ncbi:MAG TPA: hypothetical protein PLR99_30735, partial [Polyangiaceae bacterium]|nr:hypothetical protein [Polyangiaceae bacterium]